jgi:hypothetical protein
MEKSASFKVLSSPHCCCRVTVDHQEMLDSPDSMAPQDSLVSPVVQGPKETLAYRDHKEHLETRDPREKLACPVTLDPMADLETPGMLVPRELKDWTETLVHLEILDSWASREHREPRGRREMLVLRYISALIGYGIGCELGV